MNKTANTPKKKLFVIGIGPGDLHCLTRHAQLALQQSTDIVGYTVYLSRLKPQFSRAQYHPFELGQEIKRAQHAITLAQKNRCVALVSSGDANIYGMSPVLIEVLKNAPSPIPIEIIPGISAFQALAAQIGAPIGHDFCVISLSNLLTSTHLIQKRLEAAAIGDFVTCLYNPASKSRQTLIKNAWQIMQQYRPSHTPVAIGKNLAQVTQQINIMPLNQCPKQPIEMNQIILIGNSQTNQFTHNEKTWLLTPRGYPL